MAKNPSMPESEVVNACLRWLYAHGCFVWRNNTGAYKPEGSHRYIRFGLKGSADIIGVAPNGRFLAIECKAGKNTLSAHQECFRDSVEEKRGLFVLARSIDDLEARKAEILAKQLPARYADGVAPAITAYCPERF